MSVSRLLNYFYAPRIYLALFIEKISCFIEHMPAMILSPKQLVEFNKMGWSRADIVYKWSSDEFINRGLFKVEKIIVDKYLIKGKRVLVLFCGGGRDSIALAKLGFEITGVDVNSSMIEIARRNAAKNEVKIDLFVQDVAKVDFTDKKFDYVIAFYYMYGSVPGSKMRIEMLKRIREILNPGGLFIFDFIFDGYINPRDRIERIFSKFLAFLTLGNLEYQAGDKIHWHIEFNHHFKDKNEIYREANSSGFYVVELRIDRKDKSGFAVLKNETGFFPQNIQE